MLGLYMVYCNNYAMVRILVHGNLKPNNTMRYILINIWLFFPLFLYSQNEYDLKVSNLINEERYFELNNEYIAHKDSLSDFLRSFTGALLDTSFHLYEEAIAELNTLIEKHQDDMGFQNTTSMVLILASNYANSGNYKEAIKLLTGFLDEAGDYLDITVKESFISERKLYKILEESPTVLTRNAIEDVEISFTIDSIGGPHIYIPAKVYEKEYKFMLDNGSSFNVISKEMANEMNIKLIADSIKVKGTDDVYCKLGIIDSLVLGDIRIDNVYFLVYPDVHAKFLTCVLGDPLIRLLKELQIYPNRKKIIIPKKETVCKDKNVIHVRSQYYISAISNYGNSLVFHLDLGSGKNILGYKYFKENKDEVEKTGEKKAFKYWGVGGEVTEDVYVIPEIAFSVSNIDCKLDDMYVSTVMNDPFMTFADGRLGIPFILQYDKVILNLETMCFVVY